MKFDHLSPTQFEELCYDLLKALGATKINWRKGTPRDSSPADQGRDLECEFQYAVPGAEVLTERRFIECKHHTKGVPPSELAGALAWATSSRPDALYFMVSGFLSNAAKEYLSTYTRNTAPPFRIHVWERPQLEERIEKHSRILRKYHLVGRAPQIDLLHPAHLEYTTRIPLISLDTFFKVLDGLEARERDEFLGWVSEAVIKPRYRDPKEQNETLSDLRIDPVNYSTFKEKCRRINLDEVILVHGLVSFSLQSFFRIGDHTTIDETKRWLSQMIELLEARLLSEGDEQGTINRMIERHKRDIATTEARVERNYRQYESFCELVLKPLLDAAA